MQSFVTVRPVVLELFAIDHSTKLGNDEFKVTLYVFPNRMDDRINSDHSYLETLEKPLCSALMMCKNKKQR